tara:strand:+ start:789 stop:1013 length:225 start_codon:yes stop_codon:yes gene_type:complete
MDLVTQIILYESGELDTEGILNLFSKLIKSGQAWTLQGSYGRYASRLIEVELLTKDGKVTDFGKETIENSKETV